jgi:hypothetical protein
MNLLEFDNKLLNYPYNRELLGLIPNLSKKAGLERQISQRKPDRETETPIAYLFYCACFGRLPVGSGKQ